MGKLGSGKSILLANIVDDLNTHAEKDNTIVAYFFCRHDIPESLKAQTIISSLARQLLHAIPDLTMVAEVYEESQSIEDTEEVLRLLFCSFQSGHKAYFILNRLDECDNSEREALTQQLQKV